MQNINYKYTTFGLLFLLVLIVSWNHNAIFNSDNSMTSDSMGMMMKKNTHMMRMSDGSMMEMNNDGTMTNNASMKMGMMDMTMNDMVSMMKGKSGKELEKEFLTGMVPHHQGAVDMAKLLLADKTISPEIKKFAEDIISAQESEINLMNSWLKSYK